MTQFVKNVLIGFIVVIVLACIAILVFLWTFDVNRYRPQIIQQISESLSRETNIGHIGLTFRFGKGLTVLIKDLTVKDDPNFSADNFLSTESVYLNADIASFLFKQQVAISKIEILNPHINLIRNTQGIFNVETLSRQSQPVYETVLYGTDSVRNATSETASKQREDKKEFSFPQMLIQSVILKNGNFTLTDQAASLTASVEKINFKATGLSLQKPFPVELQALFAADQPNIKAIAKIFIDVKNNKASVQNGKIKTDLSLLQLEKLPFYVFLKEQLLFKENIEGIFVIDDISMNLGREGLIDFSSRGELTGGKINSGLFRQPFKNIDGRFHIDQANIDVSDFSFSIAAGVVSAHGRLSDYGKSNMIMADFKIEDVQLNQLIPADKIPVLENNEPLEVEGLINANFDAQGRGLEISVLEQSLQGDGVFQVSGGMLNVNLLRFVLNKLSFLPDLAARLEESLPPQYKQGLQSNETVFRIIESRLQLKDAALFFEVQLQSDLFELNANGDVNLQQDLALTARFSIPQDLSTSMVLGVGELSYLLDSQGKISIPFKSYQGKIQDVRIYPDVQELGKKVFQNKGKQELRRAIFKALDIEERPNPSQTQQNQTSSGQNSSQQEPHPQKALIDGIFDAILNGQEKE